MMSGMLRASLTREQVEYGENLVAQANARLRDAEERLLALQGQVEGAQRDVELAQKHVDFVKSTIEDTVKAARVSLSTRGLG